MIFQEAGNTILLLSWWVVFINVAIDSRMKTPDVEILVPQIESEVKANNHNSSSEWCYDFLILHKSILSARITAPSFMAHNPQTIRSTTPHSIDNVSTKELLLFNYQNKQSIILSCHKFKHIQILQSSTVHLVHCTCPIEDTLHSTFNQKYIISQQDDHTTDYIKTS